MHDHCINESLHARAPGNSPLSESHNLYHLIWTQGNVNSAESGKRQTHTSARTGKQSGIPTIPDRRKTMNSNLPLTGGHAHLTNRRTRRSSRAHVTTQIMTLTPKCDAQPFFLTSTGATAARVNQKTAVTAGTYIGGYGAIPSESATEIGTRGGSAW